MFACDHSRRAAAHESLLDWLFVGNNLMAFKKLDGQERNLPDRFYLLLVDPQIFAKCAIDRIVIELMAEYLQRDFLKLFLVRYRKYVGLWDQGVFLVKV